MLNHHSRTTLSYVPTISIRETQGIQPYTNNRLFLLLYEFGRDCFHQPRRGTSRRELFWIKSMYALAARHSGRFPSSNKIPILIWCDRLLSAPPRTKLFSACCGKPPFLLTQQSYLSSYETSPNSSRRTGISMKLLSKRQTPENHSRKPNSSGIMQAI